MNETLLLFALFLVLSLLGVPVAFALSLAGSIGICALLGFGKLVATLPYIFYGSLNSFTLIAIPLYVLMGNIIIRGKLSEEMYAVFNSLFGHLPGGLAIITCLFCGVFAAISGSSVATAATVGMLVLPEMIRLGYERKFVYGLIAGSGTLGILIPPSLNFLLYGALTEVSVGELFIAGIIPGIVLCSMFLAYGLIFSFAKKYRFGGEQIGWKDKLVLLKRSFWSFFVIPFILIGIYKGIFTPTEAAGIGCRVRTLCLSYKENASFKRVLSSDPGLPENKLHDTYDSGWSSDFRVHSYCPAVSSANCQAHSGT